MGPDNLVVLKDDLYDESELGHQMEFRLTYKGPLMATQRDPVGGQKDARAGHKHDIRKQLHPQLQRFWRTNRFLRDYKIDPDTFAHGIKQHPDPVLRLMSDEGELPLVDVIASRYHMFGYTFVPLVCEDLWLSCSIDVLFLRRDAPGSVIQAGDIDNRLKTLMDALRMPKNGSELVSHPNPGEDETPFFCLLEDDKLITRLAVETDWLLEPSTGKADDVHQVHLVMKIVVRPEVVSEINVNFA